MFDFGKLPAINTNVQKGLEAIGAHKDNINRDQLTEAYYLIKNNVLGWGGDTTAIHGAMNVIEGVAQRKDNLDRHNAADAAKAMKAGQLSIVTG